MRLDEVADSDIYNPSIPPFVPLLLQVGVEDFQNLHCWNLRTVVFG